MLPIDMQAELIRSFQNEKRQRFVEMQERQQALNPFRRPLHKRVLQKSGEFLVAAGRGLQRSAGVPQVEFESRRLGWEK